MNFSTAFDALVVGVQAALPSHTRLADPYDLEKNGAPFLRQAWGLAVAPAGENTMRFVSATRSLRVGLTLVLSRQLVALDSNATAKATTDKDLMADLEAIVDAAWTNQLGASSVKVDLLSWDGISTIETGAGVYRALSCNLTVEYFRD
jgi:hypothetical protein